MNSKLERIGLAFTMLSDENLTMSVLFFINKNNRYLIFISLLCASQKIRKQYVSQLSLRRNLNQNIQVDDLFRYSGMCFIDAETDWALDIFKKFALKSRFKNKFYWKYNIMPQKSRSHSNSASYSSTILRVNNKEPNILI